jgi:hypothetical protein
MLIAIFRVKLWVLPYANVLNTSADQEVESDIVEELDHLSGGNGGRSPDQCEAIRQRWPALDLILARSRDSERLAEVLLVQTHDPVMGFVSVVAPDQQELLPCHSLR